MFEEVGEQYHQFLASSRTSLPLSLPFPLHGFDTFSSYHHHQQPQTNQISIPQLHHKDPEDHHHHHHKEPTNNLFASSTSLELERERSIAEHIDPWSSDEVLALHKIRSGTENWFQDFTWEHVSKKLEDLGFKRSAEKCKEKFEEESRHFNSMSFGKNYRLFGELEVMCLNDQNAPISAEKDPNIHNEQKQNKVVEINNEEDSRNEIILDIKSNSPSLENEKKIAKEKIKRKRNREFETLKGFCEEIVRKIMTQQEEMHSKIIEDMVKRDEEKIANEKAWMEQEMERINKEIEIRAHEQAVTSERQTKLIEFLQKITADTSENTSSKRANDDALEVSNASISSKPQNPNPFTSIPKENPSQNPSLLTSTQNNQKVPTSTNETLPLQNPNTNLTILEQKVPASSSTKKSTKSHILGQNEGEEIGKRWPREEVLALIKLRGNINANNNNEEKEGTNPRGPLWERISQGMLGMGYKRSAKRCKEKWENINKYFRKTKDANKKRSMDSRTCPYFQQLSNLYSQGGSLMGPIDLPENRSPMPVTRVGSIDAKVLVDEGEKDFV